MSKQYVEIPKLDIKLKDVEGAFNSEGQSRNVWCRVPIPMEIIRFADKAKENGGKSCIWTAYDDAIFDSAFDRSTLTNDVLKKYIVDMLNNNIEFDNHKLMQKIYVLASHNGVDAVLQDEEIMTELRDYIELKSRSIPSQISATFKSGFRKYAAVVENLAMHIAMSLDMPTSYNYIVAFDKDQYPEIVAHYDTDIKKQNVQPLGIVSIDVLQNKEVAPYEEDYRTISNGEIQWNTITKDFSGDKLEAFVDTLSPSVKDNLSGEKNLISNWIKGIHRIAERYMIGFTEEGKRKSLENTDSRIIRSFLLREFLGDCDFTALNGGTVINFRKHTFRYAPNFDYGESFNGLVKGMLDVESNTLPEAVLNSLPEAVRQKLLEQSKQAKKTIEEIASSYASSTSEENLNYAFATYPQYSKEFIDNLNDALSRNIFDKLVDKYTFMTHNGTPLLTQDEAETFKKYLKLRGEWMTTMANAKLNNPESTI